MEDTTYSYETSKSYPNENCSDNTSSLDSKYDSKNNEKSHKHHKNFKKVIHKIFQPGSSIQIKISNMKLVNIPFQQTRIYVKAKVGHSKSGLKGSSRINISEDNTVHWNDEMSLHYKLPFNSKDQKFLRRSLSEDFLQNPMKNEKFVIENNSFEHHNTKKSKNNKHNFMNKHKAAQHQNTKIKIHPILGHEKNKTHQEKHSLKPFYVRFSFRLEDNSGIGHTRYGVCYLNLKKLHSLTNYEFKSALKYCDYETIFTCNISIKSNKRSSCGYINTHRFISQEKESYFEQSFSDSESGYMKRSEKANCLSKSQENHSSENSSDSDNTNKHTEWKLLESLADQYTEQQELPFKIKTQKYNDLSQQVEDILKKAMCN